MPWGVPSFLLFFTYLGLVDASLQRPSASLNERSRSVLDGESLVEFYEPSLVARGVR